MASKGEELNTRITATDEASAVVDKVADKVADLEDRPHEAKVTADTSDADEAARQLDKRLEGLTDDEKRVVLELQARNAQRDLDRINRDLANAHKLTDDELQLRIDARDAASAKLQAVQSELRELDGQTVDVEIDADSSSVDELLDKLQNLPGRMSGMGAAAAAALKSPAAAVAALTGAALVAGETTSDLILQAGDLSRLTGDTVDMASRLNAVWRQTGADAKDLQDVLLQMGGVLAGDAELVRELGLNLNDGRTLGERFVQVVGVLGRQFDDAGERSVVASKLFGEEGVRQVNTVIARVGDLQTAIDKVGDSQTFDESDVEDATKYKQELAEIQGELQGIVNTLGTGLLPLLGLVSSAFSTTLTEGTAAAEQYGRNLRRFFDSTADANHQMAEEFAASEQAARDFDRQLIRNAQTTEQVRRIARDYGLDLHAQNLIVVEWSAAHRAAEQQLADIAHQAGLTKNEMQGMLEGGFRVEDLEQFREAVGLTSDELSSLRESALGPTRDLLDQTRQKANDLQGAFEGAFDLDEMVTAANASLESVAGAVTGLTAELDAARQQISDREAWLDLQEQLDQVAESEEALRDAVGGTAEEVEAARRTHERALLRLDRMVLDLIERYDDIPAEKITELRAVLHSGSVDQFETELGRLVKDRFVTIHAVSGSSGPSFDAARVRITPGARPSSPSYTPPDTPAPASTPFIDARQTTVYYPSGTSPTSVKIDQAIYERRNGQRP